MLDHTQLDAVEAYIGRQLAEDFSRIGVLVVVFIHGWHHNARWARTAEVAASAPDGDSHFHSFRLILEALALREAERYAAEIADGRRVEVADGRRVIGVYVGWNGDPLPPFLRKPGILSYLTFWDRYRTAKRIGASPDFKKILARLIGVTKPTVDAIEEARENVLILIGHSMGALMLENAFLSLLESGDLSVCGQRRQSRNVVNVKTGDASVNIPDLLLAVNSAADSSIAKRIWRILRERDVSKVASSSSVEYSPPVVMSATSVSDHATRWAWRLAQFSNFRRRTDGNDESLRTHRLKLEDPDVECLRRDEDLDYGQNWHCLRRPQPPRGAATPEIRIDLPTRERRGVEDKPVPHARYLLAPVGSPHAAKLMWAFQVPSEIRTATDTSH
jgi:hypothetical protein